MFDSTGGCTNRREFLRHGGVAGALAGRASAAEPLTSDPSTTSGGLRRDALDALDEHGPAAGSLSAVDRTWDLSWVKTVGRAKDKALIDAPGVDGWALEIAQRYLDGCDAVYGRGKHDARVVLNIRTRAIPIPMSDALWARFALGAEYAVKDSQTNENATRNPFLARTDAGSLPSLLGRGAIVLVCDFAMGHLATRLATKLGISADAVHKELLAGLIPGAIPMPSGMFGLAKAQNAGCAFISTT